MKNAILREVQVLRLGLNWIVHSIFGLFNMCFLFLTPVKCALLGIHSSVAATLLSVSAKHKFKKLNNDTDNFKLDHLLNFRPASILV